ncbi:electron transfer flavoprotein subunit beta/FixA family protein [Candidatus Dependentiae bacterium]|nr:electron transfer flavoprotein subunit beta/FixA family protein [Candidatus Dependentiae bacterium]
MKIIVLIKQVPDTTNVSINPDTNTLMREGVESIINPFDMYAIEEALRLKERLNGEPETVVLSMGPPQVETALREALSMGIDKAVLLTDRKFAGSDTLATSYTLAAAIKKLDDYSLVLCGKQAIDGDTAQVGPGVATWLDLPIATYIRKIEEIDKEKILVERLMDMGYDRISLKLPALLTVVKELNEPRLPSLRGKLKAKKAEIINWGFEDLGIEEDMIGLDGSPTYVVKIFSPPPKQGGEKFHGNPEDSAKKIFEYLTSTKII